MTTNHETPFIPILTIMVDYGGAPFLWLADSPEDTGIGLLCSNGLHYYEDNPLSIELWRKFAKWVLEFHHTAFYSEKFNSDHWDWLDYHKRGLELARLLKEEVGDKYRVVYDKPFEDPNGCINERTEILATGELLSLPPLSEGIPDEPQRFFQRLISGGQTGADRAALDFAIKHRYPHGGWIGLGRKAEDGSVPLKYQLTELTEGGYRQRTRRNIESSDGTLILNLGKLDGGTQTTIAFAQKIAKPYLVIQLDNGITDKMTALIIQWLVEQRINVLNIAGPRESKRPGIYSLSCELLQAIDRAQHTEKDS